MKRRDFLTRTAAGVSASLLLGNVRSEGYRFVGSALAAGEGEQQKATLEQKFAEFALSIKYEALPADVIIAAKRVLLDTLGCAFGAVGSEPAIIAETTIRKTFGDGNAPPSSAIRAPPQWKAHCSSMASSSAPST
jgi:2-methylcitrate dehydratase